MIPWDIVRGQPFQGWAGGKPLFHILAGLPPCRRRTRQAVSLQKGRSLEVSRGDSLFRDRQGASPCPTCWPVCRPAARGHGKPCPYKRDGPLRYRAGTAFSGTGRGQALVPHVGRFAALPPADTASRVPTGGWSLGVSVRQPAISSLLSILPKMPGMDSRSTGSGASMGTVSRSSSPT